MMEAMQPYTPMRPEIEPPPSLPVHRYVSAALAIVFIIVVLAALLLRRGDAATRRRAPR